MACWVRPKKIHLDQHSASHGDQLETLRKSSRAQFVDPGKPHRQDVKSLFAPVIWYSANGI